MSAKFSAAPAVPQPPPICRKSVPSNWNPSYPPWRINTWIALLAADDNGNTLDLNQTWSLPRTIEPAAEYSVTTNAPGWTITITLTQQPDPSQYALTITANRNGTADQISATTGAITPISTDPFNTGINQLTFTAGSGQATARCML